MEERLKKLMEMLPEELDGAILLAPVHRKYYLGDGSSFVPQKSRQLYPH